MQTKLICGSAPAAKSIPISNALLPQYAASWQGPLLGLALVYLVDGPR